MIFDSMKKLPFNFIHTFKDNAIKVGVEVFITIVNSFSLSENAGIFTPGVSNESLWYYH